MIKGGIGGGETKTGLKFEEKVELSQYIASHKGYKIVKMNGYKDGTAFNVYFKNKIVAKILKKASVKKFLENEYKIVMKDILSKALYPDESIFINENNTFHIIEIKYQQTEGSTDEKLQTSDFKIKQWEKVVSLLDWKVKFSYVLNDWFKNPKYKDMLDYIKGLEGCDYYFHSIPLNKLGLKLTEIEKK